MPQSFNSPFANKPRPEQDELFFPMDSDDAFHATPIVTPIMPTKVDQTKTNPTFMQNSITIQRSPSKIQEQASALSRQLSDRSSSSSGDGHYDTPAIAGVLLSIPQDEQGELGHPHVDSASSTTDLTNKCTLSKSSSQASGKSVQSLKAVGAFAVGSLHVHSPSPPTFSDSPAPICLQWGDVVVIRDIPVKSIVGFDTRVVSITKQGVFEGINSLPPGTHFVWGGSQEVSLRTGFWIMSCKKTSDELGEVIVKRWDKYNEVLDEEVSAAEIRIQQQSLSEYASKLVAYDLNSFGNASQSESMWRELTSCIKGALLNKVTGHDWNHWKVSSTDDYKPPESRHRQEESKYHKDEVLAFVFPKSNQTFSTVAIGRDRTEQAMDTTSHVMKIIADNCTYEDSDEIVGEMQFCYITGMVLGNLACMEQWAYIVKIVFKAHKLLFELPNFFQKFLRAFLAELKYDEDGLEGSIFEHDPDLQDDLKQILTIFKSRLHEQMLAKGGTVTLEQRDAGQAFTDLECYLWKQGWDLRGNYVRSGKLQLEDGEIVDAELSEFEAEDERGEFAPTVVELDDEGREKGLIRL